MAEAPSPMPEPEEPRQADPTPRSLSKRDYVAIVFRSVKESGVAASGRDSIFDFSAGQKDRIDLSAIDANTQKGGNQAFAFIGTKEFSGKAGQLRYEKARSDTYLSGDVNGDKIADFTIHLDDRLTFSKGYFIL